MTILDLTVPPFPERTKHPVNADQFDTAMQKLSRLADTDPYDRVYGWRQVLDRVWRAGFEAGYTARSRDEEISDRIAEQEKGRALSEEPTAAPGTDERGILELADEPGDELPDARSALAGRVTNDVFAAKTKCDFTTASKLKNGRRLPSASLLVRIWKAFDLDLDEIVAAYDEGQEAFGRYLKKHVFEVERQPDGESDVVDDKTGDQEPNA